MLRMHMACSSLYNTTNDTHNGGDKEWEDNEFLKKYLEIIIIIK